MQDHSEATFGGGSTVQTNGKGMSGRLSDLGLSFVILTIPMLLFSACLIGLVFHFRVTPSSKIFENLNVDRQDDAGIYYVNLSATFLIFIASWSSSLAPALTGFALTLFSYPLASEFFKSTKNSKAEQLPTPYQLALALRFLNGGGLGTLWNWIKYLFTWRGKRQAQPLLLSMLASMALLGSFLGFVVFLADTWLHITTSTVSLVQVAPVTDEVDYSFHLLPNCTVHPDITDPLEMTHSCGLNIGIDGTINLFNGSQSLQVLNNASSSIIVLTHENEYTYLGSPPSEIVSKRDYTATTFGLRTQCELVSNECNLNAWAAPSTPFYCSETFHGDVTGGQAWYLSYFNDSIMSSNISGFTNPVNNPFYWGLATLTDIGIFPEIPNPDIIEGVHGGLAFVVFCNSTLYDVQYDSVDGVLTRFVTTPSNTSTTNLWQLPLAISGFGTDQLKQAASLAAVSASTQELTDRVALTFSTVALAVGSQSVGPQPALEAQQRTSLFVARVLAAPLFTLVISNLLFVVLGIVLTVIAILSSGGDSQDIQARLSITGLVADRFEGQRAKLRVEKLDELFEECNGRSSKRVFIDSVLEGGYEYKALLLTNTE